MLPWIVLLCSLVCCTEGQPMPGVHRWAGCAAAGFAAKKRLHAHITMRRRSPSRGPRRFRCWAQQLRRALRPDRSPLYGRLGCMTPAHPSLCTTAILRMQWFLCTSSGLLTARPALYPRLLTCSAFLAVTLYILSTVLLPGTTRTMRSGAARRSRGGTTAAAAAVAARAAASGHAVRVRTRLQTTSAWTVLPCMCAAAAAVHALPRAAQPVAVCVPLPLS